MSSIFPEHQLSLTLHNSYPTPLITQASAEPPADSRSPIGIASLHCPSHTHRGIEPAKMARNQSRHCILHTPHCVSKTHLSHANRVNISTTAESSNVEPSNVAGHDLSLRYHFTSLSLYIFIVATQHNPPERHAFDMHFILSPSLSKTFKHPQRPGCADPWGP